MKKVERLKLRATPEGGEFVFPNGRLAAVGESLLQSSIENQSLDYHEVVNGHAPVMIGGLRLRVLGLAVGEDEKVYRLNYLVAQEGAFARAFKFGQRITKPLINKLLYIDMVLKGKTLQDPFDIYPYSPANLLLNVFSPLCVVRPALTEVQS